MQKLILTILISLLCCTAKAVELKDLYSFTTLVSDNTQPTRAAILPQALDHIILKLAGSRKILSNPQVLAAKQQADQYVRDFAYRESSGTYQLTVNFDENMIDHLVASTGTLVLTKNRPVVMIWLAVGSDQKFELIGERAYSDLAQYIERSAQNYGIPTVLPLLDLTERLLVQAHDVANFNEIPLQQAAGRYNVDVVLAGRITKDKATDQWQCAWRLFAGDQKLDWENTGSDLMAELDGMLLQLNQQLAVHYSSNNLARRNSNAVFVRVTGINGVSDYAKIMNYLTKLPPVKNVEVSAISDQEVVVALTADGGQRGIKAAIALDTLLVAADVSGDYLSYTLQNAPQNAPENSLESLPIPEIDGD